jgi:hypothetical protein
MQYTLEALRIKDGVPYVAPLFVPVKGGHVGIVHFYLNVCFNVVECMFALNLFGARSFSREKDLKTSKNEQYLNVLR